MFQSTDAPASRPWDPEPHVVPGFENPLLTEPWRWRRLPPAHAALHAPLQVLRRNDLGDAFAVIAQKYGEPNSYCVVSGNVAAVSNWQGITLAEQYQALKSGAGVFPCGTMRYLSVTGPHAADVLNLLTPRRIDTLDIGQAAFTIFTTPEGTVDTEGVVLRDGAESFRMSLGGDTHPPTSLYDALDVFPGTQAQDASLSCFNIKGPACMSAMAGLLSETEVAGMAALAPFRGMPVRTRWGSDAWILRTGIGIEMWGTPEVVNEAWRTMVDDPGRYTPCGWDVLDSYRVENRNFAFYLCPLDIHRGTYVLDVGLGHTVSRDKPSPFIGREALLDPARWGGRMWIGGLTAEDADAPARKIGEYVFRTESERPTGYVTTAGYSPREGRHLGFAHLAAGIRPGDSVCFADGSTWRVSTLPMRATAPTG